MAQQYGGLNGAALDRVPVPSECLDPLDWLPIVVVMRRLDQHLWNTAASRLDVAVLANLAKLITFS